MLIKCPECNKEISNLSEICVYCGFPIKEHINKSAPPIIKYEKCPVCQNKDFKYDEVTGLVNCKQCGCAVGENKYIFEQYRKNIKSKQNLNLPKCPYCNSTNIKKISAASKAGSAVLFGIFATGKINKQWHCNHCGSDF